MWFSKIHPISICSVQSRMIKECQRLWRLVLHASQHVFLLAVSEQVGWKFTKTNQSVYIHKSVVILNWKGFLDISI